MQSNPAATTQQEQENKFDIVKHLFSCHENSKVFKAASSNVKVQTRSLLATQALCFPIYEIFIYLL